MKILSLGEVMVEMASADGVWLQSYGGDTFNTAIYLARAGHQVDYMTALGDDHFSQEILAYLKADGVNTDTITCVPDRQPGLYTIHNDPSGEREFGYWRNSSPARECFDQPVSLKHTPQVLYFSGITLAVMRSGIENLVEFIVELRSKGCRIVFDPNYRPKLWDNPLQAQEAYARVLKYCDIVLPTLDDETLLWGVTSIAECHQFYNNHGVKELVIKADGPSCHVFSDSEYIHKNATPVAAIDTTGAGDSFNAGYLASRCHGNSILDAIDRAQQLAAQVVQHRGAVLPRS